MITVIIRYFQLIRYFKDRYDWIQANPTTAFDFSQFNGYPKQTYSTDQKTNNLLNMLRVPEAYELRKKSGGVMIFMIKVTFSICLPVCCSRSPVDIHSEHSTIPSDSVFNRNDSTLR